MLHPMKSERSIVTLAVLFATLAFCAAAKSAPATAESLPIKGRLSIPENQPSLIPSTGPAGPKETTTIDREIVDLKAQIEQSSPNAANFVKLGDRLMQKSRESMDGRLYGEAESAYKKALEL